MEFKTIIFEKKGHVANITLNRGGVSNRVNYQMSQEIGRACREIMQDKNIRAVVLNGAGVDFCAGLDIAGGDSTAKGPEMVERANYPVRMLAGIEQPVIAAISGAALGIGLGLALCCDIRLASEDAVLGTEESDLSFPLLGGVSQRLPRIAGRGRSLEMLFTGEPVVAGEAFRLGLVNRVVPRAELVSSALTLAEKIAARAPVAEKYVKEAVMKGLELTMDQGMHLETDLYMIIHTTRDRTEGISSFLKKKPPEFKGE